MADNPACNPLCRVCHYKELDYEAQILRKQNWAQHQLGRWSGALRQIIPAPESERLAYRSKSWMRSSFENGAASFGMYRSTWVRDAWVKEFVSWDSCPLQTKPIQEMIEKLRRLLTSRAPHFLEHSLTGLWLGGPHVVVVARHPASEEIVHLPWNQILVPPFDRVWFHRNPQVENRVFGRGEIKLFVGPAAAEAVHPIRAFRQVARSLLAQSRDLAVKHLLQSKPEIVLDLYCGTGELALLLPPQVAWIGIEQTKEAARHANGLRPNGPAVHTAFAGSIEHRLGDSKVLGAIAEPYALYINPPRTGLAGEARYKILTLVREKKPTVVVYLSCSASSLARDLEVFAHEGYGVELLQPYDFFPQTEHFETLAVLQPPP